jgi:hypothetical protein
MTYIAEIVFSFLNPGGKHCSKKYGFMEGAVKEALRPLNCWRKQPSKRASGFKPSPFSAPKDEEPQ